MEALVTHSALRDRGDDYEQREREYQKALETITVKYPDDLEAKALLALATMGKSRYGAELMIRRFWRSSRTIRARTITAFTTGITTSRSKP